LTKERAVEFVIVRVNWDRTALPFHMPGAVRWFDLHVGPEAGHPFGRRGLALAAAWERLGNRECTGMLVMDGDVQIDPLDLGAMGDAIAAAPGNVLVGPVRLWPASTMRPSWVWGHWRSPHGPSQEMIMNPNRWGFGFTYLPRRLLAAADAAGLREWEFPNVDMEMSQLAARRRIPARVVQGCHPKHMHY
jgi:hypothetical protein